jgi:hypothetical protein
MRTYALTIPLPAGLAHTSQATLAHPTNHMVCIKGLMSCMNDSYVNLNHIYTMK